MKPILPLQERASGRGSSRHDAVIPSLFAALVAALLLCAPTLAQRLPSVEAEHYSRCMEEARQNPAAALDNARDWEAAGGGHPARHCVALAFFGLKKYTEAATRLDKLADDMAKAPSELRASVLDQAGQAWLLAGDAARAEGSLTAALAVTPDDPDLLIDRAEAYAAEQRYPAAIGDLDHALQRDPERVDALVYRAAAYRATEKLVPALRDIEAALRLAPKDVDALLERGNIRRLSGDDAGARQDWRKIAELAPGSPAALAAKDNLAKLDAAAAPQQPAKPSAEKVPAKKTPKQPSQQ